MISESIPDFHMILGAQNQTQVQSIVDSQAENSKQEKTRDLITKLSKQAYLPQNTQLTNTLNFLDTVFKKYFNLTTKFPNEQIIFEFLDRLIQDEITNDQMDTLRNFDKRQEPYKQLGLGAISELKAELAANLLKDKGSIQDVLSYGGDSQTKKRKSQLSNDDLGIDLIIKAQDARIPFQVKSKDAGNSKSMKIQLSVAEMIDLLTKKPGINFELNFTHSKGLIPASKKINVLKVNSIQGLCTQIQSSIEDPQITKICDQDLEGIDKLLSLIDSSVINLPKDKQLDDSARIFLKVLNDLDRYPRLLLYDPNKKSRIGSALDYMKKENLVDQYTINGNQVTITFSQSLNKAKPVNIDLSKYKFKAEADSYLPYIVARLATE